MKYYQIFIIMPFNKNLYEIFEEHIKKPLEEKGHSVSRTDNIIESRTIMEDVKNTIKTSDIIIADLTEKTPTVFYGLGIAHAENKYVIQISQKKELAFDIRKIQTIIYEAETESLKKLSEDLLKEVDVFKKKKQKNKSKFISLDEEPDPVEIESFFKGIQTFKKDRMRHYIQFTARTIETYDNLRAKYLELSSFFLTILIGLLTYIIFNQFELIIYLIFNQSVLIIICFWIAASLFLITMVIFLINIFNIGYHTLTNLDYGNSKDTLRQMKKNWKVNWFHAGHISDYRKRPSSEELNDDLKNYYERIELKYSKFGEQFEDHKEVPFENKELIMDQYGFQYEFDNKGECAYNQPTVLWDEALLINLSLFEITEKSAFEAVS